MRDPKVRRVLTGERCIGSNLGDFYDLPRRYGKAMATQDEHHDAISLN